MYHNKETILFTIDVTQINSPNKNPVFVVFFRASRVGPGARVSNLGFGRFL